MDTEGKDGKGCCSKEACAKSCCGKALAVIGLLALGGIGGFIGGRYCATGVCPLSGPSAPQQPAK